MAKNVHTGLDEGGAESDHLVVLAERDVGNCIGNGNTLEVLLGVAVVSSVRLVAGAEVDVVVGDTEL